MDKHEDMISYDIYELDLYGFSQYSKNLHWRQLSGLCRFGIRIRV